VTGGVRVRDLTDADLTSAASLHRDVLDMEFLSRFGSGFMRTYYRAWLEAPGAVALAAVDEHGTLVGALLGAVDPATHTRAMVRGSGARLAARLVVYAVGHPPLAKDLVVTRGRRYAGGLVRMVAARFRPTTAPSVESVGPRVGEITHVLVRPDRQGSGIGRALVDAAVRAGTGAELDELVLVTPPELEAPAFYERLGWLAAGEIVSRSGEHFLRYRFPLPAAGPAGADHSHLPPVPESPVSE
jgi:ribosomal protein S18 acetylase RimI-like enzyme